MIEVKVGDLVRYNDRRNNVVGIVLKVARNGDQAGCKVQWSNGAIGNHSKHWLIKIETLEDK